MAAGQKYRFMQLSASLTQTVDTAPVTVTFSVGAQPDSEVRIVNCSTATVFIGMAAQSTSSAAITAGMMLLPVSNGAGAIGIFRTGGNTKLAAVTVGATQTTVIRVTGGEGI